MLTAIIVEETIDRDLAALSLVMVRFFFTGFKVLMHEDT